MRRCQNQIKRQRQFRRDPHRDPCLALAGNDRLQPRRPGPNTFNSRSRAVTHAAWRPIATKGTASSIDAQIKREMA
jgi:hypothetical protein